MRDPPSSDPDSGHKESDTGECERGRLRDARFQRVLLRDIARRRFTRSIGRRDDYAFASPVGPKPTIRDLSTAGRRTGFSNQPSIVVEILSLSAPGAPVTFEKPVLTL